VTRPISLDEAKADPRLKDMVLVNNSRLSVQPVSDAEWQVIVELAGGTRPL
ncbi:MAG: EVE domain-containing protein, partial [Paracoccus sp.]|nr:EVE domain-containing protein [Paracoccus sp. (in: a-proteobacteria)]